MKRKTDTPAEPVTLTAQRIVLTAPDGSPRLVLNVDQHGLPSVRLFNGVGVCRALLQLGFDGSGGENPPLDNPRFELLDSDGKRGVFAMARDGSATFELALRGQVFQRFDLDDYGLRQRQSRGG